MLAFACHRNLYGVILWTFCVILRINTAKNMFRILRLIHIEFVSYFCDASLASCGVILNSIKNCTPILVYMLNICIYKYVYIYMFYWIAKPIPLLLALVFNGTCNNENILSQYTVIHIYIYIIYMRGDVWYKKHLMKRPAKVGSNFVSAVT